MSKGRKGQRQGGLKRLLLRLLQALLEVFAVLKESCFNWVERRKDDSATGSAINAAAQPAAGRQQQRPPGAPTSTKQPAAPTARAGAAAPNVTRPRSASKLSPPAFASDSEEEEGQQASSAPLLPNSWAALAAAPAQEAGWEAVRNKKQQRSAAGGTQSAGPARRGGGGGSAAAQPQQRKRGELRACERPGCGAEGRGFRKCGRWASRPVKHRCSHVAAGKLSVCGRGRPSLPSSSPDSSQAPPPITLVALRAAGAAAWPTARQPAWPATGSGTSCNASCEPRHAGARHCCCRPASEQAWLRQHRTRSLAWSCLVSWISGRSAVGISLQPCSQSSGQHSPWAC
jgi:hypothetical protein